MFIGTVFPPVLVKNHTMSSLGPAETGASITHCRAIMDVPLKGLHWTVETGSLIYQISRFSDPIHAGRYYCQAQVDGATSSLTPSNALTFTVSDSVFNLNPCGDSSSMELEDFIYKVCWKHIFLYCICIIIYSYSNINLPVWSLHIYSCLILCASYISHYRQHLLNGYHNYCLHTVSRGKSITQFVGVCVSWCSSSVCYDHPSPCHTLYWTLPQEEQNYRLLQA